MDSPATPARRTPSLRKSAMASPATSSIVVAAGAGRLWPSPRWSGAITLKRPGEAGELGRPHSGVEGKGVQEENDVVAGAGLLVVDGGVADVDGWHGGEFITPAPGKSLRPWWGMEYKLAPGRRRGSRPIIRRDKQFRPTQQENRRHGEELGWL